ncbi:MAG: SCO family protein [Bacteroidetes bacterium]|nr:SCO family protein [Bacteroidota bacterium]
MKKSFYIAAGVILIPVLIYFLLKAGNTNFKRLPYLGERIAPDGVNQKDTLYYTIPDFDVTDQSGKKLSLKSFDNKIFIANFFFASCKEVCPAMNKKLALIYDKFKEFSEIEFISFTVDPENDSITVLADYAKKYKADPKIWHFTNTNMNATCKIGQGFLLPVSNEDKTIDHSQQLILVDKEKHIRGVYNSFDEEDMKRLNDELKVLLYEYHQPGK